MGGVWRYQRSHQNPKSKKNRQHNGQKKKDKRRSTKHTYKTKDWITRTPLKTGGELRCSRLVSSSCSTSGIRRVNLVTWLSVNCCFSKLGMALFSKQFLAYIKIDCKNNIDLTSTHWVQQLWCSFLKVT